MEDSDEQLTELYEESGIRFFREREAMGEDRDLVFDGTLCLTCGVPIPANYLGCAECCGMPLEPPPGKHQPKAQPGNTQTRLFDLDYPA